MVHSSIQNLLQQVQIINDKYKEIAKITGENFNIFSVLNIEAAEVYHSKILGMLLDPKGSHEQGSVFLKRFIEIFDFIDYDDKSTDEARVYVEEYIGLISEDYNKGGRIDIVIKLGASKPIVIENKIYAADQYKQLWRYNQKYPDSHIIYLTLDGKEPSKESLGELKKERIIRISYKDQILKWLTECQKISTNFPLLRETLTQYINLIKILTRQTINTKMNKEIVDVIIANGNNVQSAFVISTGIVEAKKKLMHIFLEKFKEIFNQGEHYGFKADVSEDGFSFINKNFKYPLEIYFLSGDSDAILGLAKNELEDINQSIRKQFEELLSNINFGKQRTSSDTLSDWGNWVWIQNYDSLNGYINKNDLLIDMANRNFDKIDNLIEDIDAILSKLK